VSLDLSMSTLVCYGIVMWLKIELNQVSLYIYTNHVMRTQYVYQMRPALLECDVRRGLLHTFFEIFIASFLKIIKIRWDEMTFAYDT
jgi:hypothetical protein